MAPISIAPYLLLGQTPRRRGSPRLKGRGPIDASKSDLRPARGLPPRPADRSEAHLVSISWSPYVVDLIKNLQRAMRKHMSTRKLRFLLYPSGLLDEDLARIEKDNAGVIWLGK